ncbi:uncharacterized protein ACA1_238850 [Acanthamoeba castellanii str. Neff]|uniref:Uncharacterized protein n=1 Tax=Acanthamoeba castellanii (strain ATCC 30010 / Neff) TaxID=1257118 RepID=L8GJR8_ACACF|nr:uncharacterized protein ACA1_238850 [Acanthamoeba castellanii str. Neff]ELR13320.1 hypothetical protein ACA1_238850 [Acanthamoeba castellanii str. Neff]
MERVKLIDFEFSLSPGSSTDDVGIALLNVFAAGLVLLEELLDIQYLYEHQRESEALTAYLAQLMAEGLSHKERCDRLASKLKAMRLKCGKRPPVVLLGEEAGAMALDLVHKLTQHSARIVVFPFESDMYMYITTLICIHDNKP